MEKLKNVKDGIKDNAENIKLGAEDFFAKVTGNTGKRLSVAKRQEEKARKSLRDVGFEYSDIYSKNCTNAERKRLAKKEDKAYERKDAAKAKVIVLKATLKAEEEADLGK